MRRFVDGRAVASVGDGGERGRAADLLQERQHLVFRVDVRFLREEVGDFSGAFFARHPSAGGAEEPVDFRVVRFAVERGDEEV